MPPVAAAVLPHPPLLVPELAGAAAAELDPLRAACRQALTTVLDAADLTILVGEGPVWGVPGPSAPGSFRPYGADVEVTLPSLVDLGLPGLPAPARLDDLPLSLAVAAHLLAGLDAPPGRLFAATVPPSLGPGAAAAIGRVLAAGDPARRAGRGTGDGRVGLVAMGDLSACRTERAPGAFRPEAAAFDASVAEAFRTGKPERLLDLDPTQAADLLAAGRVPLQVLAGAYDPGPPRPGLASGETASHGLPAMPDQAPGVGTAHGLPAIRDQASGVGAVAGLPAVRDQAPGGGTARGGLAMRGQVLYDDAPYGVGYLVALLIAP
jgi:hypothetical protein